MNTDDTNPENLVTDSEESPAQPSGPRIVVLADSMETDPNGILDGPTVSSIYHAWRLAWHPAVLCRMTSLPITLGPIFDPPGPDTRTTYIVPGRLLDQVPSSFLGLVEDIGTALIVASDDYESSRTELFRRLRGHEIAEDFEAQTDLVDDFQALGVARLWLASATIALGHVDVINHDDLTQETLAAADRWKAGDFGTAKNHLRAAFEVLQVARERFYPVDCFLVDLVMAHPTVDVDQFRKCLADESPKTIVGPAIVLETLAEKALDVIESIKAGVDKGWLDLAGGPLEERPEHL